MFEMLTRNLLSDGGVTQMMGGTGTANRSLWAWQGTWPVG